MDTETLSKPYPANNPSPEFNTEAVRVIQAWRMGELSFVDGLDKINALIAEAVETGHRPNEAYGKSLLGVMYHHHGEFEQSIQHYEYARQIFAEVGNRRHTAGCNLNMGEVYRYMGNYSRALQMYRSAAEASEALNDPIMQSVSLANQGQVLLAMEHHDSALVTLQKALDITQQFPDNEMSNANKNNILSEIYQSLTRIYLIKNQPLDSWKAARQAFRVAEESGEMIQRGMALRAMGDVLTVLQALPEVLESNFAADPDHYYHTAYKTFGNVKAEAEQAKTIYAQGESLSKRGKWTAAARKFRYAMIAFGKLGMVDDAAKAGQAQMKALLDREP
jgi:tetratricopeptide (TPR) repeat protein